jgi:hypothetical protein
MEKYLVILILIVILYYLHRYCIQTEVEKFMKIKEGFGDAVTVDGVDDNNAINTLAKIAKDLQEGGGLKVMGKLNLRDKHILSSDDDGWLRLRNKDLNQYTNMAVKDLWVDGSLTTQGGFKGGLFGDSSTNSSIGLYHPVNKYTLFSIGASTSDGNKAGWNQVNIRADDLQFKNANSGNTTVTTNGNHIVTEKLVVQGNIQVGGQTLTEDDIKRMKSMRSVAGWAIDGDNSTAILMEGSWKLNNNETMDAWTCDRWDIAYVFKGWKVTFWDGANFDGGTASIENKTDVVKKIQNLGNWPCSYKAEWVGY